MKVKLTPQNCHEAVSKTSGKPFFIANAEQADEGGDWKTCRWTILSDKPIPPREAEFVVQEYKGLEGTGRARPA